MSNMQKDGNLGESPTRSDLIIPILAQKPYETITNSINLPISAKPSTPGAVYYEEQRGFVDYGFDKWLTTLTHEDWKASVMRMEKLWGEEGRAVQHSPEPVVTSDDKSHWYFLTYTQNNDFDLDADTMISVIRRLDTVNDRTASILQYEGCIEHCQSGKIHAHVIVHLSASPSGGVKKFFEGRYTLKKMKIGNIHVRRVNFKTNPKSLEAMRAYCAKEGFRKFEKLA